MRTKPYSLAVIAFDEMDLLDVAGPLEVFSTAGRKWNWRAIKAELISSTPAAHSTRAQLQIGPALPLESCQAPELLLVPGGYGARLALQDQALVDYLVKIREGLSLTLTVGLGALLAARAGLLQGAEVATTQALALELTELDSSITPRIQARPLATARAITAPQNGASIDLGLEVVARLLGKSQANGTARELGYDWGETFQIEIKT
jgi:transcriptional regulator GlxA family with amidase domain